MAAVGKLIDESSIFFTNPLNVMVAHTLKPLFKFYLYQVPAKNGCGLFTCYHVIIIQPNYSKSAFYYTFLLTI